MRKHFNYSIPVLLSYTPFPVIHWKAATLNKLFTPFLVLYSYFLKYSFFNFLSLFLVSHDFCCFKSLHPLQLFLFLQNQQLSVSKNHQRGGDGRCFLFALPIENHHLWYNERFLSSRQIPHLCFNIARNCIENIQQKSLNNSAICLVWLAPCSNDCV